MWTKSQNGGIITNTWISPVFSPVYNARICTKKHPYFYNTLTLPPSPGKQCWAPAGDDQPFPPHCNPTTGGNRCMKIWRGQDSLESIWNRFWTLFLQVPKAVNYLPAPPVARCASPPVRAPRNTGKDENIAGAIRAAPFAFHSLPAYLLETYPDFPHLGLWILGTFTACFR